MYDFSAFESAGGTEEDMLASDENRREFDYLLPSRH
jgi:hypothetical protein